jgi:hypothetical protein
LIGSFCRFGKVLISFGHSENLVSFDYHGHPSL